MRTKKEIQRQIDGLESMKKWFPEKSFFGDNNWEMIDAQIDVLKNNNYSDYENEVQHVEGGAYEASEWLNENSDGDLFETQDWNE